LQVVDEDHQRRIRTRQGADESTAHQRRADLGLVQSQLGYGPLRSDQGLVARQDVEQHPGVGAERIEEIGVPDGGLLGRPRQHAAQQGVEDLGKGRGRTRPLRLIELALDDVTAGGDDRLRQTLDQRGLADARLSRNAQQAAAALALGLAGHESVQPLGRRLAAIEPVRDPQRAGHRSHAVARPQLIEDDLLAVVSAEKTLTRPESSTYRALASSPFCMTTVFAR
jgi:hypothetical protein